MPCRSLVPLTLALLALSSAARAEVTAPDPVYLDELVAAARQAELARSPGWLRLGHWRTTWDDRFEAEPDGPAFYLSPAGKQDPAAELEATLRAFFEADPGPPDASAAAADTPQCRFPARFAWLAEALAFDPVRLPPQPCPRFEAFAARLSARSVAVVFSSYYLNTPASAFGHTFLRMGKAEHGSPGDRYDLIDQGVSYAASPDTKNPIVYTVKAFVGGFRGDFSVLPYFYKVREYADYESRDLWEYELELAPREIAMLVAHLWELGQSWFDYFYLTENCSYHLLGALEAAAPRLELLRHLGPAVLPADAVKALYANPGLVREVRFRPSARTVFEARAVGLSGSERAAVAALADGEEPPGFAASPAAEQVAVLDAALDLVDVRYGRALVDGDPEADALRQRLLEQRSALAVPTPPLPIAPPTGGGPHQGHPALRLGVGGGASSTDGPLLAISARLALHDLVDPPTGFPLGTELEFLKLRTTWFPRAGRFRLDEATVVEAAALNPFGQFDHRISWKMRVGAASVMDAGCDQCVAGRVEAGAGPAVITPGGALTAGVTLDVETLWSPGLHGAGGSGFRPGIGPGALLRLLAGRRAALLATATWRWLPAAEPATTFQLGVEGRVHLGPASLSAEWRRTPLAHEGLLSILLYPG